MVEGGDVAPAAERLAPEAPVDTFPDGLPCRDPVGEEDGAIADGTAADDDDER